RDPGRRHDPSERAARRRLRSRGAARLRLRDGHRSGRPPALRPHRPPALLRQRSPLPRAVPLLTSGPMRIPLSWLAEFVTWSGPAAALAERLTMAGLKIEAIEEVGQLDRRIVAGRRPAVAALPGIADTVLEAEVTPNRGDCLSVLGVAREVAAVSGARLRHPRPRPRESGTAAAREVRIRVEAADLCPRYCARVVRGVGIVPSPLWVRLRLRRAGMRALNAVVDATNYVMLERGQPLHAFDLERLA